MQPTAPTPLCPSKMKERGPIPAGRHTKTPARWGAQKVQVLMVQLASSSGRVLRTWQISRASSQGFPQISHSFISAKLLSLSALQNQDAL